jgi:hypothetical protein
MCIDLGIAINELISGATSGLTGLTGCTISIYPVEIREKAPLPIIVYDRITNNIEYTKDGAVYYDNLVTMYILTAEYADGITIGKAIIDKINNSAGTSGDIHLVIIRLKSIEESAENQIFQQKLEFNIKAY